MRFMIVLRQPPGEIVLGAKRLFAGARQFDLDREPPCGARATSFSSQPRLGRRAAGEQRVELRVPIEKLAVFGQRVRMFGRRRLDRVAFQVTGEHELAAVAIERFFELRIGGELAGTDRFWRDAHVRSLFIAPSSLLGRNLGADAVLVVRAE